MTIKRAHGVLRCEKLSPYCWYLTSITVEPRYKNKGIGTALMQRMIEKCPGTIYLLATGELGSDTQRLYKFYERFGFRKVKDRDDLPFNYNMIREGQA